MNDSISRRRAATSLTSQQQALRKRHLLTRSAASRTSGIVDAVVAKDGNLFLLMDPEGNLPIEGQHSLGLYHQDTRYLRGCELRIANIRMEALMSTGKHSFQTTHELTNPPLELQNDRKLPKGSIGVRWEHILDEETLTLSSSVIVQNYTGDAYTLPISLHFAAQFEDIYLIRGLLPPELHGTVMTPKWKEDRLVFSYEGLDGCSRSTRIAFEMAPDGVDRTTANWNAELSARGEWQLSMTISVHCSPPPTERHQSSDGRARRRPDIQHVRRNNIVEHRRWLSRHTGLNSNSVLFNRITDRALLDLRILRADHMGQSYISAGIPWFATLYGRDSIIVSLQTLAFNTNLAAETLRLLAEFQGQTEDQWRDEEPGKILHALRFGEMARAGQIPHSPYYGTVDATALFLILMARYTEWTGDVSLFRDLRENVERALEWIDWYADKDRDGYAEYYSVSTPSLINQGWKDSGDAIVNSDGSLAKPPIALVEAQGYTYAARQLIAGMLEKEGDREYAGLLRRQAEELRARFNQDYWMKRHKFYGLALQDGGELVQAITSNPGHALWTGIADTDLARLTRDRIMKEDMYSGWGVRTLSASEKAYNPISYHRGSVWPHDNGLIAAGFRRYGFDESALRICTDILEAVSYFPDLRLPELFCGFSRDDYERPVPYPVACHPQAWAAGALLHIVETLLGLQPAAFARQLHIVRPQLPANVSHLSVEGLRVGQASLNLTFVLDGDRTVLDDAEVNGDCRILVEY